MMRKAVEVLPTFFVVAAVVFVTLLVAPHPTRVLVISLVGSIVVLFLAWANGHYNRKCPYCLRKLPTQVTHVIHFKGDHGPRRDDYS